ncbi:MAG: hypothetical protein CMA08_01895 [Euryarchaeota archaeon]|nr:hypothetical protein [Euryarchaeota archaeon]OUX22702.1 MAG: hypothetical protein CBE12_01465 [Euryarchaeota archaeon TMED252]
MADLRLESDQDLSLVAHLEEFSARITLVLLILIIGTVVLAQHADTMLVRWLDVLAPCTSCMVVFEPGAWIGLRWTSAIVCAGVLTLPLIVHQAVSFASPALLPGERRRLTLGLTCAATIGVGIGVASGGFAAPYVYANAMQTVDSAGLVLALDAVALVQLTLALMWITALLGAASGAALGAGLLGRLDRERVVAWRWRISLPLVLLIVGSTWATTNELRWPLAVMCAVVLEVPLLPWRRREPQTLPAVLDHEGRRRRVMVINCANQGAPIPHAQFNNRMYRYSTSKRLGDHQRARTVLIERIQNGAATDVVLLGCPEESLPARFVEAVASTGAGLHYMDHHESGDRNPSIADQDLTKQLDQYVTDMLGQ